ncbi:MAG: TatD family hydrolase [Bacteroidales bacterium]
MEFVDSHAHLYLDNFKSDIKEVCQRAKNQNVNRIYLPNIDGDTIDQMLNLETQFPELFKPMMGLHPSSVNENFEKELEGMKKHLTKRRFSAIGETGMDLYWDTTYRKEQERAFEIQLNWAKEFNLPVVIHSREAFEPIIKIIEKNIDNKLKGVFHSFSGNLKQAERIIHSGFKMGINGIVTFKNSKLDEIIKKIDITHLILETDAPFLAPVPKRGKRNESSYIPYIAEKIAEIKNMETEDVAIITTSNTLNLFKL